MIICFAATPPPLIASNNRLVFTFLPYGFSILPVRLSSSSRTVPQLGGGGTTHQLIWLVLLPFSNEEGSFFGLHSLKIAIAGNIAGIYFGGACFQAFTQDRTGFVLHTVRYFCETSFSPYGFHLYTTTTVLWNSIPYGTSSKP